MFSVLAPFVFVGCEFGTNPVFGEVSRVPGSDFAFAIDLTGTEVDSVTYSWDVLYTDNEPDPATWTSADGTTGPGFLLPNPPDDTEAVSIYGVTNDGAWLCSTDESGAVTALGAVTSWANGRFTDLRCVNFGDGFAIVSAWGDHVPEAQPTIDQ